MAVPAFAASLPEAPAAVYVLDEAGVISASTEQYIIERGNALFAVCGAQIVVVAMENTGYSDMEVFAYDLFNYWGIGSAELNNGVLLAMEPSSGRIWCTVGAGLENQLSASILNNMLETVVYPYYDAGDCDTAARQFFDEMYGRMESYYGVDADSWNGTTYKYTQAEPGNSGATSVVGAAGTVLSGIVMIIGLIIAFVVIYSILSAFRGGGGGYGGNGGGGFFPFFIFTGGMRHRGPRPPRGHFGNGFGRPNGGSHGPRGGSFGGFGGGHSGGFGGGHGGGFGGGGFGGGGSRGGGAGRR